MVENSEGKGENNCLLQVVSPFPRVFSKDLYCRLKTRACLGKGENGFIRHYKQTNQQIFLFYRTV